MEKSYYEAPIGVLEIVCRGNELIFLKMAEEPWEVCSETAFMKSVKRQLSEYFSGKRRKFDVKINPEGTAFQKAVWRELVNIPYSETRSYSEVAAAVGNRDAQRAVGSACNKNPVMIIVPCHRVISKNGNLGGFACGKTVKQKLLELEAKRSD